MDSATVTFGAQALTVRALTLRQLRTVFPEFGKSGASSMPRPDGIDAAVEIIVAAAQRDQPGVTADAVTDGSIPEIRAAMKTVLELSGLVPSGEAPAAAT